MMQMRGELLEPVLEKLQKAIKKVAEEKGYTFILNTVDSQALSIVLHGPEDDDITLAVMTALGIEIPEGEE
jgi:Skp family chaperone for outer membrane proteins